MNSIVSVNLFIGARFSSISEGVFCLFHFPCLRGYMNLVTFFFFFLLQFAVRNLVMTNIPNIANMTAIRHQAPWSWSQQLHSKSAPTISPARTLT